MKLLIIILCGTLCAIVNLSVYAQYTISGTVRDKTTGEALPGANVYLKSDWRQGTSSAPDGSFKLQLYHPVDTLLISFMGYNEEQATVSHSDSVQLTIQLIPFATSIDEVIIHAEKLIAEEFTYQKVEKMDIYMNPNAKADPLLAVNSLASSTTLDESATVSFRGSGPNETGIFLNNVPIYDAVRFSQLNGIGTFSIFNTSVIDQLLVFSGNPPLEYGNTTSGLVAIQTTDDIPQVNQNSVILSLANFGLSTSRPVGKSSAINVFSNYQPSFLIKSLNQETLKDISDFHAADVGINVIKQFKKGLLFKIFNYALVEGYDFHFHHPTFDGTFTQKKKRNFTVTSLRKKIGRGEVTINNGLSLSRANYSYAISDIDADGYDFYASANYQYFGDQINLKSGFTFDFRKQHFNGTTPVYEYAIGPEFPTHSESGTEKMSVPEMYLYGKYYLSDRWILGAGLRKNTPQENQKDYLSKQVNIHHSLNQSFNINISLGEYHKYVLSQNKTSAPTLLKSQQFSLDISCKRAGGTYTLSLFYKENKEDHLKTKIHGAEAYLDVQISSRLSGRLSYTFLNGEVSDGYRKFPSSYDLGYFIKGSLRYQFPQYWTATINFQARHGQFYRPIEGSVFNNNLNVYQPIYADLSAHQRMPDYKIIDLSISRLFPIREGLTIIAFSSVNNIFNFKNIRAFEYSFDYSIKRGALYSQRTLYFGAIFNF